MKKLSIKEMVKNRKKKGFTLIELIIVIAIIAILAAMAIPKFSEVRKSANIKTDIASAKNLQTAAATILAETNDKDKAKSETELGKKLDGGMPSPKAVTGKFEVTFEGDNDDIVITAGGKKCYPAEKAEDVYATSGSGSTSTDD